MTGWLLQLWCRDEGINDRDGLTVGIMVVTVVNVMVVVALTG